MCAALSLAREQLFSSRVQRWLGCEGEKDRESEREIENYEEKFSFLFVWVCASSL